MLRQESKATQPKVTTFGLSTLSNGGGDSRGRHRKEGSSRRRRSQSAHPSRSRSNSGGSGSWIYSRPNLSGGRGSSLSRNSGRLTEDGGAGSSGNVALCRFRRQGSATSMRFGSRASNSPPRSTGCWSDVLSLVQKFEIPLVKDTLHVQFSFHQIHFPPHFH